jgi:hypothetical protein
MTPYTSGDNFGTLIPILHVAILRSQYISQGVQIQEGINLQLSWWLNNSDDVPRGLK